MYCVKIRFSNAREVQPDIIAVPSRVGDIRRPFDKAGELLLVVEVLSRTTGWRDRGLKRTAYMEQGVSEYWIVDAQERSATCLRGDYTSPEVVTDTLRWQPKPKHEALAIDLEALFRAVHGA
jgi:Uma2 family endonuclease